MEYVNLSVADGTSMRAYVARPSGHPKAGLLVFQEAFGVNAHIRDVADRFAREGYVAVAGELFHRTAAGLEGDYADIAAVRPHMMAMTREGLLADIRSVFEWVKNEAGTLPISAIGYCMGGRAACLAAITVPLACGISYYGGGIGPSPFYPNNLLEQLKDLRAPMLFFWGGLDTHIPPETTRAVEDALRKAGKAYAHVEFSYADHGFFCDARASYHPGAAAEAWALTLAFLNNNREMN